MKQILFLMLGFCFLKVSFAQNTDCPIIPRPQSALQKDGNFVLNKYTPVAINQPALEGVAWYLQTKLLSDRQIPLTIADGNTKQPAINIKLDATIKSGDESYKLNMSPNGIEIKAPNIKGAFYGVISLLQLIGVQNKQSNIIIPCWEINDAPDYAWRGLMLDESRHFFGKATVKKLLDWMAFYKLNTFHWHLTDEPGWRIEIKQYPLLTLVGGIGTYTNKFASAQYYTQNDIKEIIAYAAERQITVIPEIDMPGHATAANRAYPQYSGGGNEKHPDYTFNPGKEETYQYLTNILREVNTVFPSGMLHIGGDEVSFGNDKWMTDTGIQALMKKNSLQDVAAVEQYFMERMADSIYSMNAKMLAWDEVAGMNLDKSKTILLWWRHDQPQQFNKILKNKYKVVICPRLPFYFDFVPDSMHTQGRKWGKLYNNIEDVYNFDINKLTEIKPENKAQVLGIQANVWTETMDTPDRIFYMIFPRIAALAENAWSAPSSKNFDVFFRNMQKHYSLYEKDKINFYKPSK